MGGDNAEALDILGDGKLLKKVLRSGTDEKPKHGQTVVIHYEWRLVDEPQGEILDSSRERDEPLCFELGAQEVIPAWEHGVASMCLNELATFTIHPDLAYGDAGCGGGAVLQSATLQCEVELLEVTDNSGYGELSAEDRLQIALRAKDAGNVHFKSGAVELAAKKYLAGIEALEEERQGEIESEWHDEIQLETRTKTLLACCLNLSQCEIKMGQFMEAFQHADRALKLEAHNTKGLYRRGIAAMNLGLLDVAKADLLEGAQCEPKNADMRAQLQECQRRLQASNTKDRSTFGGMFERGSMYQEKLKESSTS